MIISALLSVVSFLVRTLFGWIHLPDVPYEVENAIGILFTCMESGLGILWLFVSQYMVLILLPLLILVANFDRLYKLGMWIVKKIPMLGVN